MWLTGLFSIWVIAQLGDGMCFSLRNPLSVESHAGSADGYLLKFTV